MITFWRDYWHAWGVAFYMTQCNASTFMQWQPAALSQAPGVPNIPGC